MKLKLKTKAPEEKVLPLLKQSIDREIKYLSIGLKKTEERIKFYQNKYKKPSPEAVEEIEPLDFVEWEGEEMTLQKILEKIDLLKSIDLA